MNFLQNKLIQIILILVIVFALVKVLGLDFHFGAGSQGITSGVTFK